MPFITYNPLTATSPVYEDARSYAVWGVSWFNTEDIAQVGGPATRPIVPMLAQSVNGSLRRSTYASSTTLPAEVIASVAEIKNWPKGRRVVIPQYWLDDSLGGNDIGNYNHYKTTDQKMLANGTADVYINSPFQRYHQFVDTKATWDSWVTLCETNGAEFDYIVDDQEQWRVWGLTSNQIIAESPTQGWQSPIDARVPFSIINDARFENPEHGDPLTKQSMRELLVYYTNLARPSTQIANTKAAIETAYTAWNKTVTNPGVAPYNPTLNPLWCAWKRTMWRLHLRQRIEYMLKDTLSKPWFTGFYSDYGVIGSEPWETPWLIRAQHPDSNVVGHPLIRGAPELYGYASNMENAYGYHPTPTTDLQRYGFIKLTDGGIRADALAGDAGRVMYSFMADLAEAIETSRVNYRRDWSAWLGSPEWDYDVSYYQYDNRYAKELYYHVALLGCNPFIVFPGEMENEAINPYDIPSTVLKEIKHMTDNGGLRPCNSAGNQYAEPDRYLLKDCLTNKGIITGGTIQHGTKRGQNLWRITVPPHIIDGSGNSFINLNGTKYQVTPDTRGAWYIGPTKPNVTITTS